MGLFVETDEIRRMCVLVGKESKRSCGAIGKKGQHTSEHTFTHNRGSPNRTRLACRHKRDEDVPKPAIMCHVANEAAFRREGLEGKRGSVGMAPPRRDGSTPVHPFVSVVQKSGAYIASRQGMVDR